MDFIRGVPVKYPDFFNQIEHEDKEEEEQKTSANEAFKDSRSEFDKRWNWYIVFYTLKGNEIDKYHEVEQMNYNTVLTHMSFLRQKGNLEK